MNDLIECKSCKNNKPEYLVGLCRECSWVAIKEGRVAPGVEDLSEGVK